jgi:hypothetical protein
MKNVAIGICALPALLFAATAFAAAPAAPTPSSSKAPAAAPAQPGGGTLVYGEGWAAMVSVPDGWDSDCCELAREHHVNLLVFPHDWGRDTPDRVMQLTVWTKPARSLAADWDADVADYTTRFPGVAPEPFAVTAPGHACRSAVYVAGEEVRQYVVFCDAGNGLGFRYAWSMQLQGAHADRTQLETAFRAVVAQMLPMNATIERREQ